MAKRKELLVVVAWLAAIALWSIDYAFRWDQSLPWLDYTVLLLGVVASISFVNAFENKKTETRLRGCGLEFLAMLGVFTMISFGRPLWDATFGANIHLDKPWSDIVNVILTFGFCFGPWILLIGMWRAIRREGDERERASL